MPFLKKIDIEGGKIGFWELSEKPEEFSLLVPQYLNDPGYLCLSSDKRRNEFLAVRALLPELTGHVESIIYKKNGAPSLVNHRFNISISHSKDLAAVLLHEKYAGIDVENQSRKVEKIAHKFLSEEEISFANSSANPEIYMTLLWSVKEAVYKCMGKTGVDFKNHILSEPFPLREEGKINATVFFPEGTQKIMLNYFFVKNNAVVWCVQ